MEETKCSVASLLSSRQSKQFSEAKEREQNVDNKGQLYSLLTLDMDAFVQGLLTLLVSYGIKSV